MGLIQELRVEELKRLSNLGVLAEFVEKYWDERWESVEEAVQILVGDHMTPVEGEPVDWLADPRTEAVDVAEINYVSPRVYTNWPARNPSREAEYDEVWREVQNDSVSDNDGTVGSTGRIRSLGLEERQANRGSEVGPVDGDQRTEVYRDRFPIIRDFLGSW